MRVVVAVSRDLSDIFFANYLLARLNVVGVLVENQVPERDTAPAVTKALRLAARPSLLAARVADSLRRRYLRRFALYNQPAYVPDFGEEGRSLVAPGQCSVLHTRGVNAINAPEYIAWLRSMSPDVVAVCGASLLRSEFLSVPRRGVLNLHGGLPQRYRGLNTTDWAVHNREPEYVGGTVHFVAPGIDDGDIVYQGRPAITADDTPHTLYEKVVRLGVRMMEQAIRDIEQGTLRSTPLQSRGALYLGKAYDDRARGRTWQRYREGVIPDYLANKAARDAPVDALIVNEYRAGPLPEKA